MVDDVRVPAFRLGCERREAGAELQDTHPGLDRNRVEYWVRQFADVLEMPELWEDIIPLLNAR